MPIVRGAPYGTASFAAMYGRYELQPRVGQDETRNCVHHEYPKPLEMLFPRQAVF